MSAPGKNVHNARLRAVVLAAGEGRRMGGSKALLVVDARPLVVRHVQRLAELGCESIAVVVRPGVAPAVSRLLERATGSRLVAQPGRLDVRVIAVQTSSQAASLAAGLGTWRAPPRAASRSHAARDARDASVPPEAHDAPDTCDTPDARETPDTRDTVFVVPVDMRPASLATLRALAGRLDSDREALAATPSCGGRGGHPIAVRAELLGPYVAATSGAEPPPLRDVLAAAGARRVRIDVDDPNVLDDLDEPADLADLDAPLCFADAAYAS